MVFTFLGQTIVNLSAYSFHIQALRSAFYTCLKTTESIEVARARGERKNYCFGLDVCLTADFTGIGELSGGLELSSAAFIKATTKSNYLDRQFVAHLLTY